jgi:predicted secreted Zn-dependent protease
MSAADGCKVINPVVYLSVQVTLPKLIPGINTTPAVLQEWERFLGALRAHELQHAVSGQHTARKVEQRLSNLQTRYSCERTKAMLTESTAALIHDSNRFDVELDKRTKHGLTQGAYLRDEVGQSNNASR